MMREKGFVAVTSLAVVLLLIAGACDNQQSDGQPELPPVESMLMDFSDFSEQPAGTKSTSTTYQNFLYSYVSVAFWNVAVTLTSALPMAAYTYALQQTPEYLGDNTWEWSYDFQLNSLTYSATLTAARISNEEFSAVMEISLASSSEEAVKWFDGVVRYDHTHAEWTFYKDGTLSVLEVEWNKDFESDAADLTYTYTEPDMEETGSYVSWEYIPEAVYDGSYTISMAAGTTHIEWNTTTIEGRVMAPANFGDEDWHCWDSYANGLSDMECE